MKNTCKEEGRKKDFQWRYMPFWKGWNPQFWICSEWVAFQKNNKCWPLSLFLLADVPDMLFCCRLASLGLGGCRFVAWVGGVFGKKEAKTLWVENLVGTCDRRSHGKKGVKRDPFVCLFVCLLVCMFVCLFVLVVWFGCFFLTYVLQKPF